MVSAKAGKIIAREGLIVKDWRGFTVAEIDNQGNIKYKGDMIKI